MMKRTINFTRIKHTRSTCQDITKMQLTVNVDIFVRVKFNDHMK